MELIYLAIPYSDPDPKVREQRFETANGVAAELMQEGNFVFSPISHSHPIAQYGLPKEFDYWEKFDRIFLELCTDMIVIKAPGWEKSKGVNAEMDIFIQLGKGDKIEFRIP